MLEDQHLIGSAIQKGLTEEGFAVDWVTKISEALHLAQETDFDAVILDLMLPDGSGLDFLKQYRKQNTETPVLILTAKDTIQDKTSGYALGTDDYLTKPFIFEELLVRVQALTRRRYQFHGQVIKIGNLSVHLSARTATVQGKLLPITAKEFSVLELLLLRRSHILSRYKIAEHIYSEESEQESNVIDVLVNKLRRKLETAGISSLIETIRGEGYVIR